MSAPPADRAAVLAERLFGATVGALELFSVYLGAELGLYRRLARRGRSARPGWQSGPGSPSAMRASGSSSKPSPGWADVYDWYLLDQYIEVSGVPDGTYILETIADPDNTILEANESNKCGSAYVRLSNVASSPTAELLGPGPSCKRPTRPR
jgi:hypothetical protein